MYITNAFSLNMVSDRAFPGRASFKELSVSEAIELARTGESAVGHPDTAAVFSDVLGSEVRVNRMTIALNKGDSILVGQYRGPRLPEGAKTLPEGATIKWYLVEII